ncbi:pseudoazurin [Sulfitobacter sp. F26169L]|uniref:pseudoazurin n=1 Tax=Sulfitobacter sp. F26169L TaxID=2996015 RepID=UPI0022608C76|nr:pseudoazurin [Sulfitobacter sp. F26169L]MCX7566149.1 pseudoazurin [Sulfitobacter sp. F26169L]
MFRKSLITLAVGLSFAGAAYAEVHEVKMLNKGEEGTMVFEPSFLKIASGDSVVFRASDKGHNAETAKGLIPDGAEGFKGKINQEIEATFEVDGVYGVICKPHFAMGMVMTIAVGDVEAAPSDFLEGRLPKKAKERFEAQLSNF